MWKPKDLLIAKRHKSIFSDEDNKEPHMNLEHLPPLNRLYQCYLWTKDQQPVHRGQLPVPILVTETVRKTTSGARSQDSGRTVLVPDLYILTNDEHWTVALETQVCSCSWIILFCDHWRRRTAGYFPAGHNAVCERSLSLDEVIQWLQQHTSQLSEWN